MENKKEYKLPGLINFSRIRTIGDCESTGSGDATCLPNGNVATGICDSGTSAGGNCPDVGNNSESQCTTTGTSADGDCGGGGGPG
ncbi:MAG: hypothetical protein HQ564_06000 [Candidatus Saganbacteria bacterium]|nr:hypothetical protein [Candidatus Saganbacteria bacterium]